MRVLATLDKSPQSSQLSSQKADLALWIGEILTGAYNYQVRNPNDVQGPCLMTRSEFQRDDLQLY